VKSTSQFVRYRVTHELIPDGEPYFDLRSLRWDVVDGAWEKDKRRTRERAPLRRGVFDSLGRCAMKHICGGCCASIRGNDANATGRDPVVWLRFEPFIPHVCCRDMDAAGLLLAAARTVFKNAGVQSWTDGKVMLAIWGDEGLEMALSGPSGQPIFANEAQWLQELVNSRHRRNWTKIDRFTEAVRSMAPASLAATPAYAKACVDGASASTADTDEACADIADGGDALLPSGSVARLGPRHFDIIGDVAVLSVPLAAETRAAVGAAILKENRRVRIVACRCSTLQTEHRKAGALEIIAGPSGGHSSRRTPSSARGTW